MRHDAPFLVKGLRPMIGRPGSPRRVSVIFNAYTLDSALVEARYEHVRALGQPRLQPAAFWIERRGQPATQRRTA